MTFIRKRSVALVTLVLLTLVYGCASVPRNRLPLYQRSFVIEDAQKEGKILEKARLLRPDAGDPAGVNVLHLRGTPYEMGFQYGRLLREEVQACVYRVVGRARRWASAQSMDEAYDLMAPYIPRQEKEEMRGLAHGAAIPLRVIHWLHAIPEVSEYRYKGKFKWRGEGTSCSNLVAFGGATADGKVYQLRVLDWNREFGVQRWPVILVHEPDNGNASVTFSFAGFIGCVSGMNEKGMAFGEMGYGNPEGESLEGIPFVFLFRKLMRETSTLEEAAAMLKAQRRTCSYVYVISDANSKAGANALLFIADRDRVKSFGENTELVDERDGERFPALDDVVYAGAKPEVLFREISEHHGRIVPEILMEIARNVSLSGNIQNVIFDPGQLSAWVSNATNASRDKAGKASNQPWFYFDFRAVLDE